MRRTLELLWRGRRLLLAAVLLVGLGLGAFAAGLKIDNSLEVWFPSGDPALTAYHGFLEEFGNDEVIVTTLHRDGATLDAERLARLERLGAALSAVDGVERVHSLATHLAKSVPAGADSDAAERVARARHAIEEGSLARRFVGAGGEPATLVLYTWLATSDDIDEARPRILDDVRAATSRALAGSGEEVSHAGMGVLYDAINRATLGQGSLFIGLSYLVIVLALLWLTRSVRWTALALLVVTLANAAVLGAMVLFERPVTMFTMALPALLLLLGVAHVVHLQSHLVEDTAGAPRSQRALLWSLASVVVPCGLNALTTAAGFASLGASRIAVTRDFGLFAAFGVVLAFVFSVGLTLAFLTHLPVAPRRGASAWLRTVVEGLMTWSVRRRGLVLFAALVVTVVALVGAVRIVPDTYALGFLPKDHVLHEHSAEVEERFGNYLPLELVVTTSEPGAWRDPAFFAALARMQTALEEDARFGQTLSIANLLAEAQRVLSGASSPARYMPTDEGEGVQLLRVLRDSDSRDDVAALVSDDDRSLRVTVTVPMSTAAGFRKSAERALAIARPALAGQGSVEPSGYLPLNWKMAARLVGDQMSSFALAFAIVFLLFALALRSWRLTLAAVPANLLPVLITLGVMGFAGIALDIATVTIAASVLGIVVDDTIHLLFAVGRARRAGGSVEEAVRRAAGSAGIAVVTTSAVFTVGFLVIASSSVSSVALVGLLTAVAIAAALVTDIVVLPAVLAFLWGRQSGAPEVSVRPVFSVDAAAGVSTVSAGRKQAS